MNDGWPYPVTPACESMSRRDITSLLERELVRLRLERRNAYSYWAHEVWLDRYTDHQKRVDFVSFMPEGGPTMTAAPNVERGTFSFYEVKSCMADLRSGNGLNFEGDENYLVMPVEMFDAYKDEVIGNPNGYVAEHARRAVPLLYGADKRGEPTFFEPQRPPDRSFYARRRATSELLMCMMRAMLANSGHSDVSHVVGHGLEER